MKMSKNYRERKDPGKKIWAWQYHEGDEGSMPIWFEHCGIGLLSKLPEGTVKVVDYKFSSVTNELVNGVIIEDGDWIIMWQRAFSTPSGIGKTVCCDEEFKERYVPVKREDIYHE